MSGFLHRGPPGRDTARADVLLPVPTQPRQPGAYSVDWHAARQAGRACCCPANPVVVAVFPPTACRPHPTDLLLCWHHCRVSRTALAAAGATVLDLDGMPIADRVWPPQRAD
jgi:hypothetical protein